MGFNLAFKELISKEYSCEHDMEYLGIPQKAADFLTA
jgi:hypothetical protein